MFVFQYFFIDFLKKYILCILHVSTDFLTFCNFIDKFVRSVSSHLTSILVIHSSIFLSLSEIVLFLFYFVLFSYESVSLSIQPYSFSLFNTPSCSPSLPSPSLSLINSLIYSPTISITQSLMLFFLPFQQITSKVLLQKFPLFITQFFSSFCFSRL